MSTPSPPSISVVIPHLNEPVELRRCLTSLTAQKSAGIPFEIIVVDNGSRELPVAVCSEFEDVRLEQERTPGPGPARNYGAGLARAPIISFIDADCVADTGWIPNIAKFFDQNLDVDFVAGDIRVARADPRHATAFEAYESIFSYRAKLYVERDHYAATGNMSVRSQIFRLVGPFGGIAISEDREWGQRATAMGFRLAFAPEIRVFTPGCITFAELVRRWDRAILHDFEELRPGPGTTMSWLLRSLAVAVSPLFEIVRILRSERVSGVRERWLAFVCLVRVRLYRAGKMVALAFEYDSQRLARTWNRE